MEKTTANVYFFTTLSCNTAKTEKYSPTNVFSKLKFDKAIAYSFDGEGGHEIIEQGKLNSKIYNQKELDINQTIKFTNDLCDKLSYGGGEAACFDPHLGLIFYLEDKPVHFVSICLDCNYLVSSLDMPFQGGFSKLGVERIIKFENENNLKHN